MAPYVAQMWIISIYGYLYAREAWSIIHLPHGPFLSFEFEEKKKKKTPALRPLRFNLTNRIGGQLEVSKSILFKSITYKFYLKYVWQIFFPNRRNDFHMAIIWISTGGQLFDPWQCPEFMTDQKRLSINFWWN